MNLVPYSTTCQYVAIVVNLIGTNQSQIIDTLFTAFGFVMSCNYFECKIRHYICNYQILICFFCKRSIKLQMRQINSKTHKIFQMAFENIIFLVLRAKKMFNTIVLILILFFIIKGVNIARGSISLSMDCAVRRL